MFKTLDAPSTLTAEKSGERGEHARQESLSAFTSAFDSKANSLTTGKTASNQGFLEFTPLPATHDQLVAFMPDDNNLPPPKPISEKTKEQASELATAMKTKFKITDLKDADREQIHSAFHSQLALTEGKPIKERAQSMRNFVDNLNTDLKKDGGKFSFREDATGNANKLSFSLVDKGDSNLVDGIPQRTVYDTMEYALKKDDQVVKNMPERASIPADLQNSFDFAHKQARDSVMKTKYGPALDAVIKEAKIGELRDPKEVNKALGLREDATQPETIKELEKRMMTKLGMPKEDYNQKFSQDVDKAFLKTLDLKLGVATTKDIEEALKKLKPSVPKDFKADRP